MEEYQRESGIEIIGDVPWGTHFCQFYQTGEDLLDILVPYFKAGLENNEFCMWVVAEPVGVGDAEHALRIAVPVLDRYFEKGQLEIIPHSEWYLKGGVFDLRRVLDGWVERLNAALVKGFDGLRITGNTAWLEKSDWPSFTEYEQAIDNVIGRYRMMALCSYHLEKCGASEVADVISNHEFAIMKRQGSWEIIESAKRKRAEEEVRKLSRAVEQSSNTIVITDTAGNIEYANPKATQLTGYAPEEVIGKNPRIFKSGQTPPEDYKQLWETIRRGGEWRGEFLNRKKNGELYWESACISPIRNSEGIITHFLAVKEDITERKQAEAALSKAREELERRVEERTAELAATNEDLRAEIAQRERVEKEQKKAEAEIKKLNEELERRVIDRTAELQAANKELEAFAYSVSHDLRAPLRHIDGFSGILLEDYHDRLDARGREYLDHVRAASRRMGQLIDDLLKLSRIARSDMRREQVDLSQIAQGVAQDLRENQPARRVEFHIADGIVAHGDARLLRLAMENLLDNAWKFTSKRSQANIEFGVSEREGKKVYFVRDDGAGFEMEYADKLFGPFQRLHGENEFPGTGIGLATVHRIIERHGGHIWAEGEVDKGAAFYFTF